MPKASYKSRGQLSVGAVTLEPSVFGNTWYVDPVNGGAGNTGRDPRSAFALIATAIAAAAAWDTIVLSPGTHTIASATAALSPRAGQRFIAAIPPGMARPNVIVTGNGGANLVDLEVSGTQWEGILFQADANGVTNLINIADTATVTGVKFKNCWFDGNGKTTVDGLNAVDATFILTGMSVEGCRFTDLDIGIDIGVLGWAGSCVERCIFEMRDTAGTDIGINLGDTAASATGYGWIVRDNEFLGPTDAGADAVGIVIAGTENTTGLGGMSRNYFAFCNVASVTIDKLSKGEVNNFVGDAATGGTLVDPGT